MSPSARRLLAAALLAASGTSGPASGQDPDARTGSAADALSAYLENVTGTRIARPDRAPDAAWFLGFETELEGPGEWEPATLATWQGGTDLAWVLVTPASPPTRPLPGAVGPDLPMATGGDRIRVPSSEDALFGTVYGLLASAAVPSRLLAAARSRGRPVTERLDALTLTGVRFGLFHRRGTPSEALGRLSDALSRLSGDPRGDLFLARLGADGFGPARLPPPAPGGAPGPDPARSAP